MNTSASRSTSSSGQPFSTADLRHCAMMLGVMEESYCCEVCFSLPGRRSHIGGGVLVSLRPAPVRVVSDVRFPHFSCFGSDGPLSASLLCTAATDFINETSVLLLVEGVEHVPSFRLSGEPRRTAAIFRRERRVLHLRPMFMPIRSDCAMSWYLDKDGSQSCATVFFERVSSPWTRSPNLLAGYLATSRDSFHVCQRLHLPLPSQAHLWGSLSKKPLLSFCAARKMYALQSSASGGSGSWQVAGHRKREEDTPACDILRSPSWASSPFAESSFEYDSGLALLPHFKQVIFNLFFQKYIQWCVCCSGNVDILRRDGKWFFFRHVQFDSGFHVMAINEVSCN